MYDRGDWHPILPEDPDADRPYDLEFFGAVLHTLPGYADRMRLLHSSGLDPQRNWVVASPNDAAHATVHDPPPCNDTINEHMYCSTAAYNQTVVFDVRGKTSFTVMLRGDDVASDRLQNAVASMTIPIVVEGTSLAWLPFQDVVQWGSFTVAVSRAGFEANASAALAAAMAAVTPGQRRQMRRAMLASRRDLLWTIPGSRVHEHVLRAAAQGVCAGSDATEADTCTPWACVAPQNRRGGYPAAAWAPIPLQPF